MQLTRDCIVNILSVCYEYDLPVVAQILAYKNVRESLSSVACLQPFGIILVLSDGTNNAQNFVISDPSIVEQFGSLFEKYSVVQIEAMKCVYVDGLKVSSFTNDSIMTQCSTFSLSDV